MNRGIYSATSAMMAGLYRQELIAHNLANFNTAGYKSIETSLDEFEQMVLSRIPGTAARNRSGTEVGEIGSGVVTVGAITNFAPGSLRETGQPYDLAILNDGFFRVETPDGERYTRDGRFTRDANGNLVSTDGFRLLDVGGAALVIPAGNTAIAADGTVTVGQIAAGQIAIATFDDPTTDLERDGANRFSAVGEPIASAGQMRQGYLETANVDPIRSLTHMTNIARAYEVAQRIVQIQDRLLARVVNDVGRV